MAGGVVDCLLRHAIKVRCRLLITFGRGPFSAKSTVNSLQPADGLGERVQRDCDPNLADMSRNEFSREVAGLDDGILKSEGQFRRCLS